MLKRLNKEWQQYEYKHTTITIIVMLLTLLFFNTTLSAVILEWFKTVGLIGGFIGGVMSVSMFTTAPALILIVELAQNVNPWLLTLVATVGSVIGDWLVILFLEDEVASEIRPLLRKYHIIPVIRRLQRTKARFIVTLMGTLAIMLPLPDEVGIALMDISHIRRRDLLLICFVLNGIGIYALVSISRAVL